jgi:hypothetical protein
MDATRPAIFHAIGLLKDDRKNGPSPIFDQYATEIGLPWLATTFP